MKASLFYRVLGSAAAVAVVTGVIFLFREAVPVLSLGVLYVFAVLPVAALWGRAYAIAVAVASMLAFNFFFLPPRHTLDLEDGANWFALAVYLVTAIVVSDLATGARRRAAEAAQREREEALLAELSIALLQGERLTGELDSIAAGVARLLGVDEARLELDGAARDSARASGPSRSRSAGEGWGRSSSRPGATSTQRSSSDSSRRSPHCSPLRSTAPNWSARLWRRSGYDSATR